jgi:hypothetical protein
LGSESIKKKFKHSAIMRISKVYDGRGHYRLVKKESRINQNGEKEYWSLRLDIGNFIGIELYYRKNVPVWSVIGTTQVMVKRG